MQAQEFSSPGVHMASLGNSGSNVSFSPPISNVIYSPGSYANINRGYSLHHDNDYGSSAIERANRYNRDYMSYNESLFNSAKDYDMYMSNTAIQRQVADLKKAGLNPILAARLGGATYKGVSAPYLQISPSSALNSFLDYGSSLYATDVNSNTSLQTTAMKNASNEFIAQYNKSMDLYLQGRLFTHEEEMVELKKTADRFLDEMKHYDDMQLENLMQFNREELIKYQNKLNKEFAKYENELYKDKARYQTTLNEREWNYRNYGYENLDYDLNKAGTDFLDYVVRILPWQTSGYVNR